ncbi:glycoprotein-N-acetylgalactosamine 3-beta-galactosyltransferase 1 [Hyalella azteca]|uniref:N-acetylgalactosaminide beta-1,3-galactosyltransferase n=1 Tax=Hyalella azteca TaxID=294128 RepID=A0A8B7NSD4_HYAAZ|nr:glycoprotein-N-acetylgalactosamine 3-beta-galactosyltransferase 1 [Hyalella azteca]
MKVLRLKVHYIVVALAVALIGLCLLHQVALLVDNYGSLLYLETFLPRPPLPHQRRENDAPRILPDTLRPDSSHPLLVDNHEHGFSSTTLKSEIKRRSSNKSVRSNTDASRSRILCMVVTSPQHHQSRAVHVKETWARRCDRVVFLSSEPESCLGEVVVVPQAAEYDKLWEKVVAGIEWSAEHVNDFEWLVKTDDDSFLLVENLRHLLRDYDHEQLYATGLFLKEWETNEPYLNGGAGYALSRAALSAVSAAVQTGGRCTADGGLTVTSAEDLNMAACFRALGVKLIDSRDAWAHQRFNVYPPQTVIDPRRSTDWAQLWLKKIAYHPYKFGYAEMSSDVISFHYVDAETMYLLYYLLYIVNPRLHDHDESSALTRRPKRSDYTISSSAPSKHLVSHLTKLANDSFVDGYKSITNKGKSYYGVVQSRMSFSYKNPSEAFEPKAVLRKPNILHIGPKNVSNSRPNGAVGLA